MLLLLIPSVLGMNLYCSHNVAYLSNYPSKNGHFDSKMTVCYCFFSLGHTSTSLHLSRLREYDLNINNS